MKSFVCIALAVFFGTVAVQAYGPKIHRNKIGGPPNSSHRFHKPPHGFHDGPKAPHRSGFPPHRPPHDRFRPPIRGGHWDDNSPRWGHGSDSSDSSGGSGSFNSYDSNDSYDSLSREKDGFDSSYEDSSDWHDHHHTKRPCTKPPKTTHKPIPTTPKSTPPTPKPTPPTSKPTPTTPKPRSTTTKPIPTTTKTPRPTRTVSPIPPITTTSRTTWHPTTPDEDTTRWKTTTSSVPVTTISNPDLETTTEGEGFNTISPEIEECIKRCRSTPEYNPVCGSDGQTYENEGKLHCAKYCGVDVTLRRKSVCPPPNWDDGSETPGTTPPTTTSPYVGRTTPVTDMQKCMRLCRITPSFSPVCGSDFVTYMNMDRLKCAQSCGVAVEVLCEKPCAACGINPPTTPKTTTSNPVMETTTEGEGFTTISPEIEECINRCPSTPEYNPVCGSDGETYENEGKLHCAKSCGVDVTLRRRSVCPPPIWDDGGETPGTTPPTTTSPYVGRTTPLTNMQKCMRLCRITPSFSPVCGTDFVTYMNMDRLKCAQSCGEVVEVLCEKPCAACGINPATTTTLRPTTTPQISRTTTQEPALQKCIKECPVTSEYNPVCGSDHVTYGNPSRLLCAELCGVGVRIARLGPCGSTTTTSTTTAAPSTLSPDVLGCIRRCPVTSEYDPVCGTDTLTYNNLGNLHCAKYCGADVDLKHKSRCVDEFDLGTDGTDTTPSQITPDVNGSKDPVTRPWKTTATTSSLFTSPTTKIPPTRPMSTSTTTEGPKSSSTIGFTIPDDVLVDIFGSTSTQAPKPKTTPNPDDDEDLDLDARYGSGKDEDKETSRSHHSRIIFPD